MAYNNMHAFVTHTTWAPKSALALLPVTGAQPEGAAPMWDMADLIGDRDEALVRKLLNKTSMSWSHNPLIGKKPHRVGSKSMNSKSSPPKILI